jgi:GTP-binding protein EngB required for normal cell division
MGERAMQMEREDSVLTEPVPGEAPVDELARLEGVARALSAEHIAAEARSLAERVAAGRFYVACIGQFKRGKSTLLNALVGESVLPTGVVPVTAVPTVIRYGEQGSAVVRSRAGTFDVPLADVAEFVAEENNPGNAKGVEAVEIRLPSAILRGGLCLVDTPGLGSVFEVATEATHAFVPHIDAALVVVGADPPISADEQALVETVAAHVRDIVVVHTKSDRVSAEERAAAIAFTRRVLAESRGAPARPWVRAPPGTGTT